MLVSRFKYYSPWKLSSASTIFCGLNYNFVTPDPDKNNGEIESPHKFDKFQNIYIRGVEWEVNPKNRIRVKKFLFILFFSIGIGLYIYG